MIFPHSRDKWRLSGLWVLVAGVAITRILCCSRLLYDIDSVDFALALDHFDPAVFQPHPPGYFLYICLGRLIRFFIPNANGALVAVSVLASCGAAVVVFALTETWFDRKSAIWAVVLFLCSPLCWFHGGVALTYMVECFFSGLVGFLCWRSLKGDKRCLVPASVALALAAGFRPSSALLLGPLWFYSMRRDRDWRPLYALIAVIGTMLLWFIPMVNAAGGLTRFWDAFLQLWNTVPGRRTALSSPYLAVARIATILWAGLLTFGAGSLLWFRTGKAHQTDPELRGFLWAWLAPGAFFFSFVFFNYINSGYLLVLTPPLFSMIGVRLKEFLAEGGKPFVTCCAVAGIALNCAVFLFAPLYFSLHSVREFESSLNSITRDIHQQLDPRNTLIVGFDSHFLGYRHAGYYLPEFVVVQYPEVSFPSGKRVFTMHSRNTEVVGSFPASQFREFAFFPLPEGGEYETYLDSVRSKLPAGVLAERQVGQHKILTGPVSLLPVLFPRTAR